jgi:hypothetical protein
MSNAQQPSAKSPAGALAVPARKPAPPLAKLKAERVQLEAQQRLKAERVQERLRALPGGWRLLDGGQGIRRLRLFPTAHAAASHAGFVVQSAAHAGQPVAVELAGPQLGIVIRARSCGLSDAALDFAQALG